MTYISALPTPPSRADDTTTFSAKADALLGALPDFVTEANALSDEVDAMRDDAEAKRAATATLKDETTVIKDAAEDARDAALSYKDTANTYRGQAETARDQAQTAAAAAGAAAGLPSLAGNAGKQLIVSAGEGGVEWGANVVRLPIFSAEAASADPVTAGEIITDGISYAVGLAVGGLAATDTMFLAQPNLSGANIATSPDGVTWTLRAVGTSAAHILGAGGSGVVIATISGSTATRKSTNHGVSWSAGGALPGNAGTAPVMVIGNICVVFAGTGIAISTDGGTSWAYGAAPITPAWAARIGNLFVIGASTSATYYTSPDGVTWTSRTKPNATNPTQKGNILIAGSSYSADGTTWATMPGGITVTLACQINGVWCVPNTTTNGRTVHNGKNVFRMFEIAANLIAANSIASTLAASGGGSVTTIPATGGPTAYFEG